MKQLMFADDPAYWFETVRSMSHIAYGGADFGASVVRFFDGRTWRSGRC